MIPIIIGAALGLAFLSSGCVANGESKRGAATEAEEKRPSPARTSPPPLSDRERAAAVEFDGKLKFEPYGRSGAFVRKSGTSYSMKASMSKDPAMSMELKGMSTGERTRFSFNISGAYSSPPGNRRPVPVIEIYAPGDPQGKPSVRQEISFGTQQSVVAVSLAGQNGSIPQEIARITLVVLTDYGQCDINLSNPRLE